MIKIKQTIFAFVLVLSSMSIITLSSEMPPRPPTFPQGPSVPPRPPSFPTPEPTPHQGQPGGSPGQPAPHNDFAASNNNNGGGTGNYGFLNSFFAWLGF